MADFEGKYSAFGISASGGGGGGGNIDSINGDSTATQLLSVGTTGTDFTISDAGGGVHVFEIPDASASARGLLTSANWSTFNSKQAALTIGNLTDAGTDGITVTGGTGAVIGSGTSIAQHVADASHNGYLSSTDWSTFNSKQSTLTIGDLTDAGTDGITVTGGAGSVIGTGTSIAQHVADATHNGYLSSANWVTFNAKQAALTIGNLTDAGTDGITVTGGTGSVIGSGTSIAQHVADATHNGYLLSTDWVSFNAKQAALTIGNITDAGTDGITITGGTGAIIGSGVAISQHVADGTHSGYLSSSDWSRFNAGSTGTLTSAHIFVGNGSNVATDVAVSGDITIDNAGVTTIGAGKVVASNIASDAVTTAKILDGNVTAAKIENSPEFIGNSMGLANTGNQLWGQTNTYQLGNTGTYNCLALGNFGNGAGFRVLSGKVRGSDGATLSGQGFSSSRSATGTYSIAPTQASQGSIILTGTATCVDVGGSNPPKVAQMGSGTTSAMSIAVRLPSGTLSDSDFDFFLLVAV